MIEGLRTMCLCVDRRHYNVESIEKNFSYFSPEIFLAGDGHLKCAKYAHLDEPLPADHKGRYPAWLKRPNSYNAFLCFRRMILSAVNTGHNMLFILEDDAWPTWERPEIVKELLEELDEIDPLWQALYLGASHSNSTSTFMSERLVRTRGCGCFHAIILHKRVWRAVLELPLENPIDGVFAERIHHEGHCYAAWPNLVVQRPGFSCVENREVDYLHFFEKLGAVQR